jgi:hypothetical protein
MADVATTFPWGIDPHLHGYSLAGREDLGKMKRRTT